MKNNNKELLVKGVEFSQSRHLDFDKGFIEYNLLDIKDVEGYLREFVQDIPDEKTDQEGFAWEIMINDKKVNGVKSITMISNQKTTVLRYGQDISGYFAAPKILELGGGGSVTVPYVKFGKQIYIGVLNQSRPTIDTEKPIRNVPRGFLAPGQNHFETAITELADETGYKTEQDRLTYYSAKVNMNSAFFVSTNVGG